MTRKPFLLVPSWSFEQQMDDLVASKWRGPTPRRNGFRLQWLDPLYLAGDAVAEQAAAETGGRAGWGPMGRTAAGREEAT